MGPPLQMSVDDATCVYIPQFGAMAEDQLAATIANIIMAVIAILSLLYYGWHAYQSTCGWEEIYVCIVELIKVGLEVFLEYCVPVTFYETNGNHIVWIRYAEWLLTCPVILIHLSNLTGLADDYNKRTMALLVSDIGTIVMGVTAAVASGYVKLAFFLLGLCYGCITFKLAGQVHLEAFYAMPKGRCKTYVAWMAVVFFTSWLGYPVLFMLGSEGFFGKLSPWSSVVGHCIVDVLSKNLWGFLGHHLRISVHEHIVEHGIVRARRTHKVLGFFELEVETFVDDDTVFGAVRSSMAGMAHRRSIQKVRSNLVAKGRACCDLDVPQSGPGSPMYSAAGTPGSEFILPSPFLLGNPRWHSSLAGSPHRVHPAGDGSHSRGVSLDWPGRVAARKSVEAPAVSHAVGQPTAPAGSTGNVGDAQAAVTVRAKASVGTPKKE